MAPKLLHLEPRCQPENRQGPAGDWIPPELREDMDFSNGITCVWAQSDRTVWLHPCLIQLWEKESTRTWGLFYPFYSAGEAFCDAEKEQRTSAEMSGKALVMCLPVSWRDKICRVPFISNKTYTQAVVELGTGSRDFKCNYLAAHCKHFGCNNPVWAFLWVEMNPSICLIVISRLKHW